MNTDPASSASERTRGGLSDRGAGGALPSAAGTPAVVFENFRYRYPGTTRSQPGERELALDGVSLTVEAGDFVGVVGESGAGKSTLAQAVVGLVPHFYRGAVGGRVLVEGRDTQKATVAELAQKVGLVFQNPFTQISGAKLTVFEEVASGLENLGVPRDEMRRRVEDVLDTLGISYLARRDPFSLSGGEMQRLAIACIMALRPRIIVLDEPTSQLDPSGSAEVFAAVDTLRERGVTIIMVEQKVEKLAAYSTKILLLWRGRVVDYGPPDKVFSRPDLSDYGVRRPVYTEACRRLGVGRPDGSLPVTLEEAASRLRAGLTAAERAAGPTSGGHGTVPGPGPEGVERP